MGTGDGGGVDSRGIQPSGSFSAPEEIERFAHWRGTIGQRQTVQMTAIFEIPRDALPAQAHVMSFGRPVGFDQKVKDVLVLATNLNQIESNG